MAASCYRISGGGTASSTESNIGKPKVRLSSESQFLSYPKQWRKEGIVGRRKRMFEGAAVVRQRKRSICWYALHDERVVVGDGDEKHIGDRRVEVAVAAVVTMGLGVGNRVLYKLALVPLKRYPFFLAQLATFG